MSAHRIDGVVRQFGHRPLSRRQALRWGGSGLAAATLAAAGLPRTAAQPARATAAIPSGAAKTQTVTADGVKAALSALEQLAQEVVDDGGVPGLAIAVVYQDEVVYRNGFGVREMGNPEPVDADTVFQLASMSKPISSSIVAAIVGDGLASWDDRLADHLPDFQLSDPWVTREITIRDCFCHRGGLPGNAGNELEELGYDRDAILHRLRYVKPESSFRSHYSYSNFVLTTGGAAAASAAGQAWEDVAAERIYKPLGMTSTSSRYTDYAAATNRAVLHTLVDDAWEARFTRQADAQAPAGGVSSTARDVAQWVRLQLGGGMFEGTEVIAADALAQTHLPHIVRGSNYVTGGAGFYGLGWNVDYDAKGNVFLSHAGAFSVGARTLVHLLPAEQIGIVVLSNAFPTGAPEGIAESFFDLVLNGEISQDWITFWNKPFDDLIAAVSAAAATYDTPPAQPAPALPLAAYAGAYANDYVGALTIAEQNGALTLEIGPAKHTYTLRHWDRDLFLYEATPEIPGLQSSITFAIAPDGTARQAIADAYLESGQGTFTRVLSST